MHFEEALVFEVNYSVPCWGFICHNTLRKPGTLTQDYSKLLFLIVRTISWVGDRYIKRAISYFSYVLQSGNYDSLMMCRFAQSCSRDRYNIFRKSLFRIMMGKSSQQQEKIENSSFTLNTHFSNRKHPGKLSSLHLKSLYLFFFLEIVFFPITKWHLIFFRENSTCKRIYINRNQPLWTY